jgi:hypothetical protein
MRKNRKRSKKMSVMASRSMHIGAVMIMVFAMVILNLLATSSCNQVLKSIGEKEKILTRLKKDCERESARWDAMKGPEDIDRALLRFGLSMRYPKPEQIVAMDRLGRPRPGQLSVARARARQTTVKTASWENRKRR